MLHLVQFDTLGPSSPDGQAWEALVQTNPASGVMQSLHWAAFKRDQGLQVIHLGLYDGATLVGGALAYAAARRGAGLLVIPAGPVLPWQDETLAKAGLDAILAAVERLAPDLGVVAVRIEPQLSSPRPSLLRSFRRAPVDQLPPETLYLDLTLDRDAILRQMRPKGRYNIRLANRYGVVVREDTSPSAVKRFYDILDEAGRRDDFFIEPLAHFVSLASALCPPRIGRFLFAEHEGDTLGAMFLTTYGPRATYLYGGVSNLKRNLMAGYALQWVAIEAARAAGCTVYDFYGYEPYGAPDHLYANFSRFKRQFGGQPRRFIGAQDRYLLGRLTDAVIRAARETFKENLWPLSQ